MILLVSTQVEVKSCFDRVEYEEGSIQMSKLLSSHHQPHRPKWLSSVWHALLAVVKSLGFFALGGLCVAFGLALLFAKLASEVFERESVALDNAVSLWAHSIANPGLDTIFSFFTFSGSILSVCVLTVVGFLLLHWRNHYYFAWLLAFSVGGSVALNQALKFFFQRPRPALWQTLRHPLASYSFPSGHSTVIICFCGFFIWLAFKFLKRPVVKAILSVLLVLCIAMVGLSRIYLGEHYLTDVIGGFILGGSWLIMVLSSVSIYDQRHLRQAARRTI